MTTLITKLLTHTSNSTLMPYNFVGGYNGVMR